MSQAQSTAAALQAVQTDKGSLADILKRTAKPRSAEAESELYGDFGALIEQLLGLGVKIVPNNFAKTIKAAQAAIDKVLTAQINEILHHPEFQQLESNWRGLQYLCKNSATDETLRIRVLNVSKSELFASLSRKSGDADWDSSDLYHKLHRDEFSQMGGVPFGALVGDYYFDHGHEDVQMLAWISRVCASCHCPFIAAAKPELVGIESWEDLKKPENITMQLQSKKHIAWNDLRKNEDSRYLAITMPRFLARMPYGKEGIKVEAFDFEEDTASASHNRFVWANAAYAMAANITRAFKESGWTVQIRGKESGGEVANLPVYNFESSDGDTETKCPTECAIDQRREAELSANGLMALCWYKGEPNAAFIGGQSLKAPQKWSTPEANKNEQLGCRLPYVFAVSRFSHFLKKMCYDKIGATKLPGEDWSSPEGVRKTLYNWIQDYVCGDVANASERDMAERPLAAADVKVQEDPDNPGAYDAQFFLRPHYQLEEVNVSMALVSKLPTAG